MLLGSTVSDAVPPAEQTNDTFEGKKEREMGKIKREKQNVHCGTYPLSSWIILIFKLL